MSFAEQLKAWALRQILATQRDKLSARLQRILRRHFGKGLDPLIRRGLPSQIGIAYPPTRENATFPEGYRGLICIPIDATCSEGFLPSGTCADPWNSDCDQSPPKVHAIAQADSFGVLAPKALLGNDIPQDDNVYERVDWISDNVGTVEKPDYMVLSWRSFAGRYLSLQPEAPVLYYRRNVISGLPAEPDALTFLGAAIVELDGDFYLVAAVLNRVSGRKLIDTAQNWIEQWSAMPHWCPGETQPVHDGHYPVHFYARNWNPAGYANDNAYSVGNPEGWRDLGAIECQSYSPSTYRKAWTHPRVIGGVSFQSKSDGSGVLACWCNANEWTDKDSPQEKDVFQIVGYQVVRITLAGVTELQTVTNPETGNEVYTSGEQCSQVVNPGVSFDCGTDQDPYINPHPEWKCESPNIRTSEGDENSYLEGQSNTRPVFPSIVIACDFARTGILVTAKLVHTLAVDGTYSVTTQRSDGEDQREYWCDPREPGTGFTDATGRILTRTAVYGRQFYNGRFNQWNLVVSGPNGFSIPYKTEKNGQEQYRNQIWFDETQDGRIIECPNAPGGFAYPTICEVGLQRDENQTFLDGTTNWVGSCGTLQLYDLDLRFGHAAWVRVEHNEYTGTQRDGQFSADEGGGGGTLKDFDVSEDADRIEIGVVDSGGVQQLGSGLIGTSDRTETSSVAWPGEPFPQQPVCDPPRNTLNDEVQGEVNQILARRTGFDGLFDINGYKQGDAWVLQGVRTDYGAADEHGNLLVSWRNAASLETLCGYAVTVLGEDAGLSQYSSYLSGKDALEYFEIAAKVEPRLGQIGLL